MKVKVIFLYDFDISMRCDFVILLFLFVALTCRVWRKVFFLCYSCPGKAVSDGDVIKSTCGHNHMADPGSVEGKMAQESVVKKAAANPKLKTSALVEEFAAKTADPSFRTRTITVKSMHRQVQRAKAKATFRPAAPKSFDDLDVIPEEFTVINHHPNFRPDFGKILVIFVRISAFFCRIVFAILCRPGCSCCS
jgi:hypothetical protein